MTTTHKTGTREEWLAARIELLKAEKELTRRSDELAARDNNSRGCKSTRAIASRLTRGAPETCAKSGKIVLNSPSYETRIMSAREFFEYANAPLEKVAITGTTATMVILKGAKELRTRFVGSTVFLGGKNPVVEAEGVFFELEKTAPERDKCGCVD